uniref:BCL2 associated athanogene 6, like n=1 Tax=Labrus bergylta TaxID=56723 RepID=A0A3Q3FA93_9LABR
MFHVQVNMAESSGLIEVTVKTLDSQSRSYRVSGEVTLSCSVSTFLPAGSSFQLQAECVCDVDGKVIHLVERAPPQASMTGSGGAGVSSGGEEGGVSMSSHASTSSQHAPHDRNGNSYVMLGTFNLPVNIMDPQQLQMSMQQMMSGVGEAGRNTRVSSSSGSNGSVDVQINVDPAVQSESRMRLQLAENLLRDACSLIHRLEPDVPPSSSSPPPSSSSSSPDGGAAAAQPTDTSSAPSSSTSTQTEGAAGSSSRGHPSPAEFVEVLSEVRRVEERLRPFIERTHSILGAATSADYNNNTQEREEDQRVLNLVADALRLLGNTLVVLGDLRCNLASSPPRHLYVIRPITHYSPPVLVQTGLPHVPLPINLGTTVTMTSNGRQAAEGPPSHAAGQSDQQAAGQAAPPPSNVTNPQAGAGGPRVIRITHQTMEPVVMMQMNIDAASSQAAGQTHAAGTAQTGLPPEFMQAIVHQISQQAAVMAAAASGGAPQQVTPGSAPSTEGINPSQLPHPAQARVVITRPSFSPRVPPPVGTRGATINLRATVPPAGLQHGQAPPLPPSSLTQMISGLVGQLLTPGHTGRCSLFWCDHMPSSSDSSTSPNTSSQTSTHTTSTTSTAQPAEASAEGNLAQLLGSLLGGSAGGGGGVPGSGQAPSITVTLPGGPGFFQGLTSYLYAVSFFFSFQPSVSAPGPPPPSQSVGPDPTPPASGSESLSPELFTGIVQGVLSTMMSSLGAQQGSGESIAQFIQRLSQTSNLFTPGSGDAVGFFGDLLSLVCQRFSMVDMVLLLHGNAQPLTRIQPELRDFFTEHYLQGREPTQSNINAAAEELINGLEEYITDSFSSVTVREGVDIVQTNLSFLRLKFTQMASHILHCSDHTFGPRLLLLCTQGLFECLALNLFCLRGEQRALTAVINHRIRRMSAEVNPSLVNWLTSMMSMRLHVILDHNPVTEDQIQHYVIYTQSTGKVTHIHPPPLSQMEESMSPSEEGGEREALSSDPQCHEAAVPAQEGEEEREVVETWAAAVPPEWVPIIRHDMLSQRKIKAQPPLSDAYLHGMPAKRRKVRSDGPQLSLSDAVSRAARAAGALPVTPPHSLQGELESPELQEEYTQQVRSDISERVRDDPDYNSQRFPNTQRAFSIEDS